MSSSFSSPRQESARSDECSSLQQQEDKEDSPSASTLAIRGGQGDNAETESDSTCSVFSRQRAVGSSRDNMGHEEEGTEDTSSSSTSSTTLSSAFVPPKQQLQQRRSPPPQDDLFAAAVATEDSHYHGLDFPLPECPSDDAFQKDVLRMALDLANDHRGKKQEVHVIPDDVVED